MKGLHILFVILAFVNVKSSSQSHDSLLRIYNNQIIYRSGTKFMKGSEKLSFRDLKLNFNSGTTKDLYYKSKSRLALSRLFNVASLGLAVVSVFTSTNTAGSIKFAVGTFALGVAGIYYHDRSSSYLDRAIWLKNKVILFGTNQ